MCHILNHFLECTFQNKKIVSISNKSMKNKIIYQLTVIITVSWKIILFFIEILNSCYLLKLMNELNIIPLIGCILSFEGIIHRMS